MGGVLLCKSFYIWRANNQSVYSLWEPKRIWTFDYFPLIFTRSVISLNWPNRLQLGTEKFKVSQLSIIVPDSHFLKSKLNFHLLVDNLTISKLYPKSELNPNAWFSKYIMSTNVLIKYKKWNISNWKCSILSTFWTKTNQRRIYVHPMSTILFYGFPFARKYQNTSQSRFHFMLNWTKLL